MAYACYACERRKTRTERPLCESVRYQQLRLGTSEHGELVILQRPQKDATHNLPLGNASIDSLVVQPPITKLPDEILCEIFEVAVTCDPKVSRIDFSACYPSALALSKVSRSFRRISQHLLFRRIQLAYSHTLAPACKRIQDFHRTIRENPALGRHCRSVAFYIPSHSWGEPTTTDFVLAAELLSMLSNITSFALHGGFEHSGTWPLLQQAFRKMPNIRHLELSREYWDLELAPVCETILNMQLNTLTVHGISKGMDSDVWSPSSRELERSLNVTKLCIDDFGETPQAMRYLLQLFKSLEHLELGNVHGIVDGWDANFFQWLLQGHRETLKSIAIGGVPMGDVSFLGFPSLETLHLSSWTFTTTSPEAACSIFLAPKVKIFVWDFTIHDQHTESWSDFGQAQKDWIMSFGQLAAAKMSALREVRIIFSPDQYFEPTTTDQLKDCVSPWDLMDEAREALQSFGIVLSYNKHWSRQECLARIQGAEEEEEKD